MIELSQPLRDTLIKLGEVEENALMIFIRGLKEFLKECEEEILRNLRVSHLTYTQLFDYLFKKVMIINNFSILDK